MGPRCQMTWDRLAPPWAMCVVQGCVLSKIVELAGAAPNRVGASLDAYKAAESLPAQKRVKKRKGPDGTSLDRVSQSSDTICNIHVDSTCRALCCCWGMLGHNKIQGFLSALNIHATVYSHTQQPDMRCLTCARRSAQCTCLE